MIATTLLDQATAFATALGALGAFITLIANLKQGRRNGAKIAQVADATGEVHKLVDGAASSQGKRIDQLAGALQGAGVDVPPRLANGEHHDGPS